jgi:hypothetical protein
VPEGDPAAGAGTEPGPLGAAADDGQLVAPPPGRPS